ncbi:hypothetical protein QFC22_006195 [Naganishia vaughanmartiniae]|uniref:Uncharacterized protein n=1 Tax=Naganishia vaughanmartiniae TaxID=1424756 RepID=A0ACC2WMK0_9TREE|nr:hypothetical protein QFC22_006195 [Naganishia vaughanmartiniae]
MISPVRPMQHTPYTHGNTASSAGHGEAVAGDRGQSTAASWNEDGDEMNGGLGSPLSPTSYSLRPPQQAQQHRSEQSSGSTLRQQTSVSDIAPQSAGVWSQASPFGNNPPPNPHGDVRSASSSVSGPSGTPSGLSTQLCTPRTPYSSMPFGQQQPPSGGERKYNDDGPYHVRQQSLQGPIPASAAKSHSSTLAQQQRVAVQRELKPRGSSEGWDKERRKAGWFANVASAVGVGRRHSEDKDIDEDGEEEDKAWGGGRKLSDQMRRGSSPIDESAVLEEEETAGGSVLRKKSLQRMRSLVSGKQSRAPSEEAPSTGAASGGETSGSSLGSFLRKHSFSSSSSRRPNIRSSSGTAESSASSHVRPTGLQISAPIGVPIKAVTGQADPQGGRDGETQKELDSEVSARPTTPSRIQQTPAAPASPVLQAFLSNTNITVQQQPGFPTPLSPPRRVSPDEPSTLSTPRARRKQPPTYIPSTPSDTAHALQSSAALYPTRMERVEEGAYASNPNQSYQTRDGSEASVQGRRSDDSERKRDQHVLPSTPQRSAVQTRPGRIIPPPLSLHQALGASLRQPYQLATGADAEKEDAEDRSSILDYDDVVIERAERVMTPSRVRKEDRDVPGTPEAPPTPSSQLMPSPMTFSDLTQQVVDISVSCRGRTDEGLTDEYEEFSWNVVIRRNKIALDSASTTDSMSPSTLPIQLSNTPIHSIVPPSASSINLSLNLHQPTGKLVFISIPPVTDIPPAGRRISHSAAYGPAISKIANARIERSPSPSPASSRQFASGEALLSPKSTSFSSVRTNPSFIKAALAPAPSESDESYEETHTSSQRTLGNAGFAYPAGQQAGQQLYTTASPPASPRDLMMRRRKASLQGGVLYTRGL